MSQIKNTRPVRIISDVAIMIAVILVALTGFDISGLDAQSTMSPISDLPMADPVIDSDAQFHAQRTSNWYQDGVQWMFLKRDVVIAVGTYGFQADSAVIRIQREAIAGGREVRHIWMYLDNAQPLPGRGPTSATAPRLLVTVSTTGKVDLATDLLEQVDRSDEALSGDAQKRFASHLKDISEPRNPQAVPETLGMLTGKGGPTIVLDKQPKQLAPPPEAPQVPEAPEVVPGVTTTAGILAPAVESDQSNTLVTSPSTSAASAQTPRILPPMGTISLAFDEMVVDLGKEQPYAVLMGHVGVMYVDAKGKLVMSLRADQAVIFLSKDQKHQQVFNQLNSTDVSGVYLEDNVQVTNGDYTIRAPRAYYDTVQNKAVILDAVMYTWSVKNKVPLYMRAKKVMQLSRTQWQANKALITTSEFAEPHFSIAARTITLTQKTDKQGQAQYHYVAQDVGVKWGNTKLFGGARMSGQVGQTPLKSIGMSYSSNNGAILSTTWDTFMLLGRDKPEDVQSSLDLDYLGQHGPGIGLDLSYDKPNMFGKHQSYLLLKDDGKDIIGGDRNDVEHDGDVRGFYNGQHRSFLDDGWELSLELDYVSDPTFLEGIYKFRNQTQRPYEASLYLKKQEEQTAMTLLTSYDVNDFTVNTSQLQYQGYTVSKLPELGFYSVGENWLGNRLTYYGETRASRMRVQAGRDSPSDRGFTAAQSTLLFGMPSTQSFRNAYSATGGPSGYVLRLDSRHEIQAPMKAGSIDVVPYAVGRVTAYDTDFQAFNGNDQNIRLWGSVGVRAHTQFNKTISDVDSRLFDINQLRHIVEPSIDVSFSDTNVNAMDLPVYDFDVERLRDGMTVAFGLRNTLQTKRGGPGRWRTVDWLTVDSRFVVSSDNAERNANSLAHYFGYRPEYTRGGDYFYSTVAWMISDSLASTSEFTYDFDQNKLTQWRTGLSLVHTPALTTFVDYEEIDTLDTRLFTYGFAYQITSKYSMAFAHRLDFSSTGDGQRSINITMIRELPRWKLIGRYRYDQIDGNQTFGIMLFPVGLGGNKYSRSIFGSALR